MRALGMSERDLKRRAGMLDALATRWQTPNPKPLPPTLADFPHLSILSYRSVHGRSYRTIRAASTSRQHLARMRVQRVGRVAVNPAAVAAEFLPDRLATWSSAELAGFAHASGHLAQAVAVDDPLARYLRALV